MKNWKRKVKKKNKINKQMYLNTQQVSDTFQLLDNMHFRRFWSLVFDFVFFFSFSFNDANIFHCKFTGRSHYFQFMRRSKQFQQN